MYEQEPFSTFQSGALDLAVNVIWPDATAEEITIERLKGGAFNRVIGLTRQHPGAQADADTKVEYILRIPRFDDAQVDSEVAVIQFLHHHTNIPCPEVVTFDETTKNILGDPYTIQIRIPGATLNSTFLKLSHEQRCRVARELGGVVHQMLAVRSSVAGRITMPSDDKRLGSPLHVAQFGISDPQTLRPYEASAESQSIRELLTTSFCAQKAESLKMYPDEIWEPSVQDRFCEMAAELDAGGWFADTHYSLAHLDFAPRNIMTNLTSDEQIPIISAVLDWDSAVLAPAFVSCSPPRWIWEWEDENSDESEDEDEWTVNNDPPSTPEGKELKMLFEEAAGKDYLRFAYHPVYALARRLVRFATAGLGSDEDIKSAEAMLEKWASLYRPDADKN
ncbi:hypothetical protein QQX98_011822 [Neonectria punicea]|uniref:Aminoglycoside phosphotransferase domain-containing protein n=1 Tax=Neonectria punicea TaxID=979145 RepID=A0ABR1GKN2_9HYPO